MRVFGERRVIHSFRFFSRLLFPCLLLASGSAESFVLWSDALPPLTKCDMATINELCDGLELQKPGTTWCWENPETGHSGRVTLIKPFHSEGMNCRLLKHYVSAGTDEPWVVEFTSCQDAEGNWVLRPDIKVPGPAEGDTTQ